MADTSSIDQEQDTSFPLGLSGNPVLTIKKRNRDGDQEAYELFIDGKAGVDFVIGYKGSNSAADDEVEIIRVITGHVVENDPSGGDEQRFGLTLGLQDYRANVTVVAGGS
jgi:hypothetical protein